MRARGRARAFCRHTKVTRREEAISRTICATNRSRLPARFQLAIARRFPSSRSEGDRAIRDRVAIPNSPLDSLQRLYYPGQRCSRAGTELTEVARTAGSGATRQEESTGFLGHLRSASYLATAASFRLRRARCATSENLYHPPDSTPSGRARNDARQPRLRPRPNASFFQRESRVAKGSRGFNELVRVRSIDRSSLESRVSINGARERSRQAARLRRSFGARSTTCVVRRAWLDVNWSDRGS